MVLILGVFINQEKKPNYRVVATTVFYIFTYLLYKVVIRIILKRKDWDKGIWRTNFEALKLVAKQAEGNEVKKGPSTISLLYLYKLNLLK